MQEDHTPRRLLDRLERPPRPAPAHHDTYRPSSDSYHPSYDYRDRRPDFRDRERERDRDMRDRDRDRDRTWSDRRPPLRRSPEPFERDRRPPPYYDGRDRDRDRDRDRYERERYADTYRPDPRSSSRWEDRDRRPPSPRDRYGRSPPRRRLTPPRIPHSPRYRSRSRSRSRSPPSKRIRLGIHAIESPSLGSPSRRGRPVPPVSVRGETQSAPRSRATSPSSRAKPGDDEDEPGMIIEHTDIAPQGASHSLDPVVSVATASPSESTASAVMEVPSVAAPIELPAPAAGSMEILVDVAMPSVKVEAAQPKDDARQPSMPDEKPILPARPPSPPRQPRAFSPPRQPRASLDSLRTGSPPRQPRAAYEGLPTQPRARSPPRQPRGRAAWATPSSFNAAPAVLPSAPSVPPLNPPTPTTLPAARSPPRGPRIDRERSGMIPPSGPRDWNNGNVGPSRIAHTRTVKPDRAEIVAGTISAAGPMDALGQLAAVAEVERLERERQVKEAEQKEKEEREKSEKEQAERVRRELEDVPVPKIPVWAGKEQTGAQERIDWQNALAASRAHRTHLKTQFTSIESTTRRALQELEVAALELHSVGERRKVSSLQMELAKAGTLGIEYAPDLHPSGLSFSREYL